MIPIFILAIEDDADRIFKACIKRFFGTANLPEIEIDDNTLNLLATETTNRGFTVPGVQKKLSLHLVSDSNKPRLTFVTIRQATFLNRRLPNLRHCPNPNSS